jgi:hypothetical protein
MAPGVLVPQLHDLLGLAQAVPERAQIDWAIGLTVGFSIEPTAHGPLMTAESAPTMQASHARMGYVEMIIGRIGLVALMRDQTARTMPAHVETLEAASLLAEAPTLALDSHVTTGVLAPKVARIASHVHNP